MSNLTNVPRGPHAATVLTGLVCTAVAALALWAQTHDGDLPGRDNLLLALGGLGGLMLLIAIIGLLTQRRGASS